MKLQYYVYFLNKTKQESLFQDQKRNKKEILLSVLEEGKPIQFEDSGSKYAFVVVEKENNYIYAKFGKRSTIKRRMPPQDKFEELFEEDWPHCALFFNLDNDSNKGQRIAFEYKSSIFRNPYSQLKAFAEKINLCIFPSGYIMSISPVTQVQNFWDIVKVNKGKKIEKLSLIFNVPNLFNLDNELEDDLKSAQKDYGITKTKIELENPYEGINIPENNKLMKQGADYIAKGGGEYRIYLKEGKKVISSKEKTVTKTIKDLEIDIKSKDLGQKELFSIFNKIFDL